MGGVKRGRKGARGETLLVLVARSGLLRVTSRVSMPSATFRSIKLNEKFIAMRAISGVMFKAKEVVDAGESEEVVLEVSDNSLRVTARRGSIFLSLVVTREKVGENGLPKCYKYTVNLDSKLFDSEVHIQGEISDYAFTSFPWLGMSDHSLRRIIAEKSLRWLVEEIVEEVAELLVRDIPGLLGKKT
jgi:hypothetical protein